MERGEGKRGRGEEKRGEGEQKGKVGMYRYNNYQLHVYTLTHNQNYIAIIILHNYHND